MKLPMLEELNTSREWLDTFSGYNHNLRIGEGEFYDMTNLSSDNFPILSPRSQRGVYKSSETPETPTIRGIIDKGSLCYVDGEHLYYNGYPVDGVKLSVDYDENRNLLQKSLISMGAYVIILPDKIYVNTQQLSDYGNIEHHVTTSSKLDFTLCTVDGLDYTEYGIGDKAPTVPEEEEDNENGATEEGGTTEEKAKIPLWLDTSEGGIALKQYSTSTKTWNTIPTVYVKIHGEASGIGSGFSVGDGVTISGISDPEKSDLNGTQVIWAKGEDYIVIKGIIKSFVSQETPICISRWMPNFDYIVESKNRLWGCKYGFAYGGKAIKYDESTGIYSTVDVYSTGVVNQIYACKLGDFKNWNSFSGISTDSYVVSLGTDGVFTGAVNHLGYPIFFKENCMHKVYGDSLPFGVQDTACRGVQNGCARSLAIVNETLYYKARSGICAYDGSLPMEISSALGDISYSDAVAGALGNKYYVSMKSEDDTYHLFVYDTKKNMWHKEDNTRATAFCNCRGDLYYIDHYTGRIMTVKGYGMAREDKPIKWSATTGVMGTDSPDKKYISRLDVRMKLSVGARVTFYAEYDSSGEAEYLFSTPPYSDIKSFAVPIKPKRCDHMRLHIVGEGDAKIFSICKTVEWGSDV